MTQIFLRLFNISVTAGWIVAAVLILRLLFRQMPKWVNCLLWGIVGMRLILPVTLESTVSLLPSAQLIPQNITVTENPAIYSGIPAVNRAVNPLFVTAEKLPLQQILSWASLVWLIGLGLLLCYGLFSYVRICRQVRISVRKEGNVYLCDDIDTPFLLGLFKPRIYVPSGMEETLLAHILAHEQAHIRRRDYLWKPLGFLLLCVYWFNPLLWVGYILLCRDIERACDEKVISQKDHGFRLQYMEALVACSLHRRLILACPVAFGEVSVKSRIKGITRYQRPTGWIIGLSVATCLVVSMCFLTSPKACAHEYTQETTLSATCTTCGLQTNTCRLCDHTYMQTTPCIQHVYDEGRVSREATCVLEGVRIRHCVSCGEKKREQIPMTDHIPGNLTRTKEPNCTESGAIWAECTVCHVLYFFQTLEPNGQHVFQRTEPIAATCTQEGLVVDTCTLCAHREETKTAKTGHDYQLAYDVAAALEDMQKFECSRCGHVKKVAVSTGHTCVVGASGMCAVCHRYVTPLYVYDINSGKYVLNRPNTSIPSVTRPTTPTIRWD